MSQVTRLARLAGRILPPDPSVHMGNFSPVSELRFQPGYFPYGQFQWLGYRDEQGVLLYIQTQIRFPIGGERVTCHESKLANSLGRTKLTNSLGKQQLELSTRT